MLIKKILFFLSLVFSMTSCGNEKSMDPLFISQKANKQQKLNEDSELFFVRGTYVFKDIDVKKSIDGPIIFKELGSFLADIIILIGGGIEVEMDPYPIDITDIDLDMIKVAVIKGISLSITDPSDDKADLKFIKKVKIHITDDPSKELTSENLILRYDYRDKATQQNNKKCNDKCLSFDINPVNLIKFVNREQEKLYIIPSMEIGKTSKVDFTLRGTVKFKLGLLLPI